MEKKDYSVYCHTCPDGMQYFGVTKNIKSRWRPSLYKNTSLQPYIEKYGWDAISHRVVASGLTHTEALKLEDELIMKARMECKCINAYRSGHHKLTLEYKEEKRVKNKARYETKKEDIKVHNKVYRETHHEERKAYDAAYYEEHKEKIKARSKAWRDAHREERNARDRERRKRKKAEVEQATKRPTKEQTSNPLF